MTESHVSYMTKEQLESYLRDLRTNRPARPAGSRPLPPSTYQQKRMSAAAGTASATTVPSRSSTAASTESRSGRLGRKDSHRRTRTTSSVSFAPTNTEYPPEPVQCAVTTGLEEDISELSLREGVHRRTKSAATWEDQASAERSDTDITLSERYEAPVAPLRINKMNGKNSTPSSTPEKKYTPNPSRYVYNEPNQFNKVKYTTNPVPLPSPPSEGTSSDDDRGRKDIGTREERGRPPLPTIKFKKQSPSPPVIAIVEAPSIVLSSRSATPPSSQTAPSISVTPSISVSAPPIPIICTPEDESKHGTVPDITVSSEGNHAAASTQPAPRRPLPTPTGNPFRKVNTNIRSASVYSNASSTGRPGATCTTCSSQISGRIVSALGARFHPECFRCYHCHEKLEHVGFFPEPEKSRTARAEAARCAVEELDHRFYCHLDFHEKFSPRCKSCKTPIEGEVIVACGDTWHVGHFFCAECGDPFTANTRFVEKDNYAWCLPCYTRRYSSKCQKCKQPVTETVVKALGGEWHVECFCCAECGDEFRDGRFFLRNVPVKPGTKPIVKTAGAGVWKKREPVIGPETEEVPVCWACEERRLKA